MNAIYTTDNMHPPFPKWGPRSFYAGQVVPASAGPIEIKEKNEWIKTIQLLFNYNQTKKGMKNEE